MSKKLIITVLAALAAVLLIAGISALRGKEAPPEESAESQPSGSEIIVVPAEMPGELTLAVPAGFTETASQYYDKYYVRADASVIVTGDTLPDYNQEVDSYAAGVKEQYAATAANFRLLSEESAEIASVPCKILEFTYDIVGTEQTQPMQCITAILIKKGKVYLITCKSHQENFAGYRGAFREMIASVEINSLNEETAPAESAPAESFSAEPAETAAEESDIRQIAQS